MIVEDYFRDLAKTVRCTTIESVHSAINVRLVFNKASGLDSLAPVVPEERGKIEAKIKAYIDKSVKQFKQFLSDSRFLEVCALMAVFEEFTAQYPEISEFQTINFQGTIYFSLLIAVSMLSIAQMR